jgi:hypothetical protein
MLPGQDELPFDSTSGTISPNPAAPFQIDTNWL